MRMHRTSDSVMTRGLVVGSLIAAIVANLGAAVASQPAAVPPAPSTAPTSQPPAKSDTPPADPTLDELLGLPTQKPGEGAKPGDKAPAKTLDPGKAELERALSPAEAREEFEQAVGLMGQTAERLSEHQDKGLETQRLQQDIIRKLDKMIDSANKQKNKSKSKSKQQSQQDKQQQEQEQQKQSSQRSARETQSHTSQDGQSNVAREDGAVNPPPPPGASASWGNLPPHVRDALLQGFSDRFSSMYKSMTEDYYKRLAEERKAAGGSTEGGSR